MAGRDGRLDAPQFHNVPVRGAFRRPLPPWHWDQLLNKVRQRPGEEAVVARYSQGTRRDTKLARARDMEQLRRGLNARYPMERWRIMGRMVPDTWYHRVIVVVFDGYYASEEERAADLFARADAARAIFAKREDNQGRRQMEARAKSLERALRPIRGRDTAVG